MPVRTLPSRFLHRKIQSEAADSAHQSIITQLFATSPANMHRWFLIFVLSVVLALCALRSAGIMPIVRAADLSGTSYKSDCKSYSCTGCNFSFENMANGWFPGWKAFCAVTDICDQCDDCECSLNECC